MTNKELVEYLANDFTIEEIEKETGLNKWTINRRIKQLKDIADRKHIGGLVAYYFRQNVIKRSQNPPVPYRFKMLSI